MPYKKKAQERTHVPIQIDFFFLRYAVICTSGNANEDRWRAKRRERKRGAKKREKESASRTSGERWQIRKGAKEEQEEKSA